MIKALFILFFIFLNLHATNYWFAEIPKNYTVKETPNGEFSDETNSHCYIKTSQCGYKNPANGTRVNVAYSSTWRSKCNTDKYQGISGITSYEHEENICSGCSPDSINCYHSCGTVINIDKTSWNCLEAIEICEIDIDPTARGLDGVPYCDGPEWDNFMATTRFGGTEKYKTTQCDCPSKRTGLMNFYVIPNPNYQPPSSSSQSSSSSSDSSSSSSDPKTPDDCLDEIASYVIPKTRELHDTITIDGSAEILHYSSILATKGINILAKGWTFESMCTLENSLLTCATESLHVTPTLLADESKEVTYNGSILHFNASSQLEYVKDIDSNIISYEFEYDAYDRVSSIKNFDELLEVGYENSTITLTSNHYNTYLELNEESELSSISYANGASYQFSYDNALLVSKKDPNLNESSYIFDINSKITSVVDTKGYEWKFANNKGETFTQSITTNPEGEVVNYLNQVNPDGSILSTVTLPSGESYTEAQENDGLNVTTTRKGVISTQIYEEDNTTDEKHLLSSEVTYPNGQHLTSSVDTTKNYTNKGVLKTETTTINVNGNESTSTYNYRRAQLTTLSAEGKKNVLRFNDENQTLKFIKPYAQAKTVFTYNDEGRLISTKTAKRETLYSYDVNGNINTITNANGVVTSFTYDARGRQTSITNADNTTTHFAYDANSNMLTLTTPSDSEFDFSYDALNRPNTATSPLSNVTAYTYDRARRLTNIEKPSGKSINYTYSNALLVSESSEDEEVSYTYNTNAQVISKNTEDSTISYTYNGDLVSSITYSKNLVAGISFSYNNDVQVDSLCYAGSCDALEYNADAELVHAGIYDINNSLVKNRVVKTVTSENSTRRYNYNAYGEMSTYSDDVVTLKLRRNTLGQITKKVTTLNDKKTVLKYSYDDRARLVEVKKGKKVLEAYTYDANSNRTNLNATYSIEDQLQNTDNATYTYNQDGYLHVKSTPTGTTTYTYGTWGELQHVTLEDNTSIEYEHNANHQRVVKRKDGEVVEKYLWLNLTTLLAVLDKNDNVVQRFNYVSERLPVSFTQNNTLYNMHYDQVGSLIAVSNEENEIVKEIVYDSFGNILNDTNATLALPFGFAGGLYDKHTKLTRFGYRDYDAKAGKWMAKDPIGFNGSKANLYQYVLNNPINLVDPYGLWDDPWMKAAMGQHSQPQFSSQGLWTGIQNVNTFSTVATVGFASDEKTLPFSIFFGSISLITDGLLCLKPEDPKNFPDVLDSYLTDELIPGNGFKSLFLKEFLKQGMKQYHQGVSNG